MTVCRGVRGATTVKENTRDAILLATRQMLALMIRRNAIESTEIASALFTVTNDLGLPVDFPQDNSGLAVDSNNRQDIVFVRVSAP